VPAQAGARRALAAPAACVLRLLLPLPQWRLPHTTKDTHSERRVAQVLQQLDFFLAASSWGWSTTMLVPWFGSCRSSKHMVAGP
jgi:hypothetical protein